MQTHTPHMDSSMESTIIGSINISLATSGIKAHFPQPVEKRQISAMNRTDDGINRLIESIEELTINNRVKFDQLIEGFRVNNAQQQEFLQKQSDGFSELKNLLQGLSLQLQTQINPENASTISNQFPQNHAKKPQALVSQTPPQQQHQQEFIQKQYGPIVPQLHSNDEADSLSVKPTTVVSSTTPINGQPNMEKASISYNYKLPLLDTRGPGQIVMDLPLVNLGSNNSDEKNYMHDGMYNYLLDKGKNCDSNVLGDFVGWSNTISDHPLGVRENVPEKISRSLTFGVDAGESMMSLETPQGVKLKEYSNVKEGIDFFSMNNVMSLGSSCMNMEVYDGERRDSEPVLGVQFVPLKEVVCKLNSTVNLGLEKPWRKRKKRKKRMYVREFVCHMLRSWLTIHPMFGVWQNLKSKIVGAPVDCIDDEKGMKSNKLMVGSRSMTAKNSPSGDIQKHAAFENLFSKATKIDMKSTVTLLTQGFELLFKEWDPGRLNGRVFQPTQSIISCFSKLYVGTITNYAHVLYAVSNGDFMRLFAFVYGSATGKGDAWEETTCLFASDLEGSVGKLTSDVTSALNFLVIILLKDMITWFFKQKFKCVKDPLLNLNTPLRLSYGSAVLYKAVLGTSILAYYFFGLRECILKFHAPSLANLVTSSNNGVLLVSTCKQEFMKDPNQFPSSCCLHDDGIASVGFDTNAKLPSTLHVEWEQQQTGGYADSTDSRLNMLSIKIPEQMAGMCEFYKLKESSLGVVDCLHLKPDVAAQIREQIITTGRAIFRKLGSCLVFLMSFDLGGLVEELYAKEIEGTNYFALLNVCDAVLSLAIASYSLVGAELTLATGSELRGDDNAALVFIVIGLLFLRLCVCELNMVTGGNLRGQGLEAKTSCYLVMVCGCGEVLLESYNLSKTIITALLTSVNGMSPINMVVYNSGGMLLMAVADKNSIGGGVAVTEMVFALTFGHEISGLHKYWRLKLGPGRLSIAHLLEYQSMVELTFQELECYQIFHKCFDPGGMSSYKFSTGVRQSSEVRQLLLCSSYSMMVNFGSCPSTHP